MTNQNTINEDLRPEATPEGIHVPIEKSANLQRMLDTFRAVHEAILGDRSVTENSLQAMTENLLSQRMSVGSQSWTAQELCDTPELKQNLKIWQEIKQGNIEHYMDLLSINDEIARILSKIGKKESTLHLLNLHTITDAQVRILSRYNGNALYLDGLRSITTKQATILASCKIRVISLSGLTELSDELVEIFSQYKGWALRLNGLTRLNSHQATTLARMDGSLWLLGLKNLDPDTARALSTTRGDYIRLPLLPKAKKEVLQALYPILKKLQGDPPDLVSRIQAAGPPSPKK